VAPVGRARDYSLSGRLRARAGEANGLWIGMADPGEVLERFVPTQLKIIGLLERIDAEIAKAAATTTIFLPVSFAQPGLT
jgi:hypothetical protein